VREQASTISELKSSLANKAELLELEKRENEVNMKMMAIKDMEIAAINRNFNQLKDVTDRAMKLAEISKPSSNWQLMGVIGLAAVLAGYLLGK
jgi:ssRNA-specific RNase YbeY (16S rRNA maturation enzyme)